MRPFSVRLEGAVYEDYLRYRLWWTVPKGPHGNILRTNSWESYCEAVSYTVGRMREARESWKPSEAASVAILEPQDAPGAIQPSQPRRTLRKRPRRLETWVERRRAYLEAKGR